MGSHGRPLLVLGAGPPERRRSVVPDRHARRRHHASSSSCCASAGWSLWAVQSATALERPRPRPRRGPQRARCGACSPGRSPTCRHLAPSSRWPSSGTSAARSRGMLGRVRFAAPAAAAHRDAGRRRGRCSTSPRPAWRRSSSRCFLIFIAEYPYVRFFFGIPAWAIGAVIVGIQLLQYLGLGEEERIVLLFITIAVAALVGRAAWVSPRACRGSPRSRSRIGWRRQEPAALGTSRWRRRRRRPLVGVVPWRPDAGRAAPPATDAQRPRPGRARHAARQDLRQRHGRPDRRREAPPQRAQQAPPQSSLSQRVTPPTTAGGGSGRCGCARRSPRARGCPRRRSCRRRCRPPARGR